MTDYIILGAGPVGLATALLLHKLPSVKSVVVYEGRHDIPNDPDQSYPIGINPRAIHTLSLIDKDLAAQAIAEGVLVDAWQIYAGSRRVAHLASRTVYGTTRGGVNLLLYDYAIKHGIKVIFDHRVTGVDLDKKTLTFKTSTGEVVIDGSAARVIAADGVNSVIRTAMEGRDGFKVITHPWYKEFRVLFSSKGEHIEGLDPKIHYIFSGCYSATVKRGDQARWTCVIGVDHNDSEEVREALMANEPSEKNLKILKEYLADKCPLMAPSFTDSDLTAFFCRRTFKASVIEANRLNFGEWALLLGDAGHCVFPATGEGINSGLEDVSTLYEMMTEGKIDNGKLFTAYNDARFPDVHALVTLARDLNASTVANSFEVGSSIGFRILQGMLQGLGVYRHTYEDFCFGPEAAQRMPYRIIVQDYLRSRQRYLLPISRLIIYPTVLVYKIIRLPFVALYWTVTLPSRLLSNIQKVKST